MSELSNMGHWRGAICAYKNAPDIQLIAISEPYEFQGTQCVTCRECKRGRGTKKTGIYATQALVPWVESRKQEPRA